MDICISIFIPIYNFYLVSRGSQKLLSRKDSEILTKQTLLEEEKTVQGALETGLKLALTPSNPPVFFLSSR